MDFPVLQSYTIAAANLTGFASNVTGINFPLTANVPGDGLAHFVTVKNDSATDHSAKTLVLTGLDPEGKALSLTMAAPGTSATVTSTKAFSKLDSVVPSATIGADTFDIGWTEACVSPLVDLHYHTKPFEASVAVVVGGTINYDVEHSYIKTGSDRSVTFKHSSIQAKTANADGQYGYPITGVRVNINSHTSGTFSFYVFQGEA